MFYVSLIRPYHQYEASSENKDDKHAQKSPTDSCDHGPNSTVGPSATQSCDELPLARRASDKYRARFQVERTRITIGLSPDRYGDVARSSANRADECTCVPRTSSTWLGRVLSDRKPSTGPAAEPYLVLSSPPELVVDCHGGRRCEVGRNLSHHVKNNDRTSYLVRWRRYLLRMTAGTLGPS